MLLLRFAARKIVLDKHHKQQRSSRQGPQVSSELTCRLSTTQTKNRATITLRSSGATNHHERQRNATMMNYYDCVSYAADLTSQTEKDKRKKKGKQGKMEKAKKKKEKEKKRKKGKREKETVKKSEKG